MPYRAGADGPRTGVLPPEPKGHLCEPPGAWRRFWKGIKTGSLWRCHCGRVWRLWFAYDAEGWEEVKPKLWVERGGTL